MCSTACPVDIDTGDLVRRLRAESASRIEDLGWDTAARRWDVGVRAASGALSAADAVPAALPRAATAAARAVLGSDRVPLYSQHLPAGGGPRPEPQSPPEAQAVLFAACVSSMFGGSEAGEPSAAQALLRLCERAGVPIAVPEDWPRPAAGRRGSQGHDLGLRADDADHAADALGGHGPRSPAGGLRCVVVHRGPRGHAGGGRAGLPWAGLRFVDSVEFVAREVLPGLQVHERLGSMALHPTCSSTQLGLNESLRKIAEAMAEEVVVPLEWRCCAYAGDRGCCTPS